jgi:hypothetical protein
MPLKLISSGGGSIILDANTTASNYTINVPAEGGSMLTSGSLSGVNASAMSVGTVPKLRFPTGCVLQVVQTVMSTTTSVAANGTERQISELNSNITPLSSSSKILITLNLNFCAYQTTYGGYFKRNGTAIGIGDSAGSRQRVGLGLSNTPDTNQVFSYFYQYLDSPASTSSVAYTFWVNNDNGNSIFINRSQNDSDAAVGKRCISTVTLTEIAG